MKKFDIFSFILVAILAVCVFSILVYDHARSHAFCTEHGFDGSDGEFCYRYTDGIKEEAEFSCGTFGKCRWIKLVEGGK